MLPSQASSRAYPTAVHSWRFFPGRIALGLALIGLLCAVWINAEIQARPKPLAELWHTAGTLHFRYVPRKGKVQAYWSGVLAAPGGTVVRLDCRAICALPGSGQEAPAHPFEGRQASVLWAVRYDPVFFNTIDDVYEMQVEGREVVAYDPDYPLSGAFPWLARGAALLALCGLAVFALLQRPLRD